MNREQYLAMRARQAKKKKRQAEKKRRLKSMVLDHIPADLIDLYPNAREMQRQFILHLGPTNSGKTHDALEALKQADSGVYLAPLRLLACEVADSMNADGIWCDLKTGEEEAFLPGATIRSSTIEMLDYNQYYDVAVIDEGQMIADPERGGSWTGAILGVCAREIHICAAPHAEQIIKTLIRRCDDHYQIVRHERKTPLSLDKKNFTFPDKVEEGDALIVFSKKSVLYCAAELQSQGIHCSVVYGALPYEARKSEVERFLNKETTVIVGTDAIGMGMNLPIRRVAFLEDEKFDGTCKRPLTGEEIRQIAGRAGRLGMYPVGYYTAEYGKRHIASVFRNMSPQIRKARLRFPESLLGIDAKVSAILTLWEQIALEDEIFLRADTREQLKLCRMLEEFTEDKQLIYEFSSMPFDLENHDLLLLWTHMAKHAAAGEIIPFFAPRYSGNDLESMERAFKICDLYFHYADKWNPSLKEKIQEARKEVNASIISYLKEHRIEGKKCRYCHAALPWNYPYKLCKNCFEEGRTYGRSRNYRPLRTASAEKTQE